MDNCIFRAFCLFSVGNLAIKQPFSLQNGDSVALSFSSVVLTTKFHKPKPRAAPGTDCPENREVGPVSAHHSLFPVLFLLLALWS